MKTKLLSQAIVLASVCGAISPAMALKVAEGTAEDVGKWQLDVGGFYYAALYTANSKGPTNADFDNTDVSTNGEIHFQPTVELDNGIVIGAHVEFEAETNGDQVDESYVFVKSKYGKLVFGSDNSAGYNMSLVAPSAVNLADPIKPEQPVWVNDFLPTSFGLDSVYRGTLGTTRLENGRNNDAKRISYYSPEIGGLKLGFSYANDGLQDNFGPTNCVTTSCNIFDAAAQYDLETDVFTLKASTRYSHLEGPASVGNGEIFGGGLHLGFGPVTIGGSYAEQKNLAADNGHAFDAGIVLDLPDCPWAFSVTHFEGKNEEVVSEDKYQYMLVGANYTYNKFVGFSVFFVDHAVEPAALADIDGTAGGVAMTLNF